MIVKRYYYNKSMQNFRNIKVNINILSKKLLMLMIISLFASNPSSVWAANSSDNIINETNNIATILQLKKVSINIQNKDFLTILMDICNQGGVKYAVEGDIKVDKSQKYTLKANDVTVGDALDILIAKTDYDYTIDNDIIKIVNKAVAPIATTKVLQQNSIIIKGKVLNIDENPVVGATIISTSGVGTITDGNGAFTIALPKAEEIEISCIGYIAQKLSITKSESNLVVSLEEDVIAVDDVVVTGIFSANRSTYTGAATQITKADIEKIGSSSIFTVLQAFDPSFRITEDDVNGSDPNTEPSLTIRGSGSIDFESDYDGDPNMPLFILDGFETTSTTIFDLDPIRIESVTILKDAAATAIYGSNASNGVVIIELVRPKPGQLRVNYSGRMTVSAPDLTSYNLLNAEQKLAVEIMSGYADPLSETYNDKVKLYQQGYDTYWLDKPVQVGFDFTHNLTVSGGDDNLTYSLNANFSPQSGVMIGSSRDKMGIDSRLQYRRSNILFNNYMSFSRTISNDSPYGTFSRYANLNPYTAYLDDEGNYLYQLSDGNGNPLFNTDLYNIDETISNTFTENLSLQYTIRPGFQVKASTSLSFTNSDAELFKSAFHTDFLSDRMSDNSYSIDANDYGLYQMSSSRTVKFQSNLTIQYNKVFNEKHTLSLNGNYSVTTSNTSNTTFSASGFVSDKMADPSFAAGYSDDYDPSGSTSISRSMGYLVNANYAYDNRYFFDASLRMDISSKFGADSRWAPFFSVGAGYNIHNEEYMNDVEWIQMLRLRGSYGITGSQNYSPYQSSTHYQYNSDLLFQSYALGTTMMGLGNDALTWQRSFDSNIGIDASLFNRVNLTLNYYRINAKDVLVPIYIAPSLGFSSYMDNLGETLNEGYEITVRATVLRKKDFSLAITANGGHNENKLLKISNSLTAWNDAQDAVTEAVSTTSGYNVVRTATQPKVRYIEGQSMNTIWVVRSLGIDPQTGKEIFLDADGEMTTTWSSDDQVAYATTDATLDGTLGLNLVYKQFSLNLYGSYGFGGYKYNSTLVNKVENVNFAYNCDIRVFTDTWQQAGDVVEFKSISDNTATKPTSRFVQKNNYLSLSSMNVQYRFSKRLLEKLHYFESGSISLNTSDLAYFSTIEVERGTSYPYSRSFSCNVQFSF